MNKLTAETSRIDVDIYNESTALFVSNGTIKGAIDMSSDDGYEQAMASHQLISIELAQDDGFIARVVLGELSPQESEEWIASGSRALDVSDGHVVVAGGNAYVSDDYSPEEIDEENEELFKVIAVPPGQYQVTVYAHLPSVNGMLINSLPQWKGYVPYFESTRPGASMPDWLAELADIDGEDVGEYDDDQEMVSFVIQLQASETPVDESPLDEDRYTKCEMRIPEVCPLGLESVGIEREESVYDPEEDEDRDRFTDTADLAAHFRPFADALYARKFEEAAAFFVRSLQEQAATYLQSELTSAEKSGPLQPVNEVWRDGESAETTIPRWTSGQKERNNLFDPDTVNEDNYIGEVRCEFGDSDAYIEGEIDLHLLVDTIAISTDDGPQLAGVVFLG